MSVYLEGSTQNYLDFFNHVSCRRFKTFQEADKSRIAGERSRNGIYSQ